MYYKELSSLNFTKSSDLDEIPAKFIMDCVSILKKKATTAIINQLFLTGVVVLNTMKYARAKPLFKNK